MMIKGIAEDAWVIGENQMGSGPLIGFFVAVLPGIFQVVQQLKSCGGR